MKRRPRHALGVERHGDAPRAVHRDQPPIAAQGCGLAQSRSGGLRQILAGEAEPEADLGRDRRADEDLALPGA